MFLVASDYGLGGVMVHWTHHW